MRLIKCVYKIYTDREREIKIENKYRTPLKCIKIIPNYGPLSINEIKLDIQN